MSFQAATWALAQRVGSPSAKCVLLALANYADEYGECWPSQARLAEDTDQSVDSVQRRLRDLAEMGLIYRRRQTKKTGWRGSDAIVLLIDDSARAYAAHYGWSPADGAQAMPETHGETDFDAGDPCDEIPIPQAADATSCAPKPQSAVLAKAADCGLGQHRNCAVAVNNQNLNPIPPLNPPLPDGAPSGAIAASDGRRAWVDDWRAFEAAWDWAGADDRAKAERAMRRLPPEDRALAVKWAPEQARALADRRVRAAAACDWLRKRVFADWERVGGAGKPARVFVRFGSPAWGAWEAVWRRQGRMPATARMFSLETTIDGERLRGTWRDTLFPPVHDPPASGSAAGAGLAAE